MSNKLDIHSQFSAAVGLAPIVGTDDTALVSEIIDMQGLDAVEFIVMSGVLADANATFAIALYESDTSTMTGDEAAVTDADLLYGAPTAWTFANDGAIQQFGYRGKKRYLRVKITPTGNTGDAPFAVAVIKKLKLVGATI